MAALVKEQMSETMNTDMKSVIRSLPKYSPNYIPGAPAPHTEILLYEDTSNKRAATAKGFLRYINFGLIKLKKTRCQPQVFRSVQGAVLVSKDWDC